MKQIKSQNFHRNLLWGITFIDFLGIGIMLPILPFLAQQLRASPGQIGILAGVFPLFQMLFMPFWGHLADRHGERPVLLASLLGSFVSYIVFAVSGSFTGLIFSRSLAGVTSATVGVVRGSLSHPGKPEATARNLRVFGAFQGLGFLLGPILGGLLQLFSIRAGVWLACALSLVIFLFLLLSKSEPEGLSKSEPEGLSKSEPEGLSKSEPGGINRRREGHEPTALVAKAKSFFGRRDLTLASASYFFLYLSFAMLFITFPLFLQGAYGFGATQTGYYFSLLAIGAVVGQMGLLPRLQVRFENRQILFFTLAGLPLGILLLSLHLTAWGTAVVLFLTSVVLFVALALIMTEIAMRSAFFEKNFVASATESFSGLARLLGTAGSGVLIECCGLACAFYVSAGAAILALFCYSSMRISEQTALGAEIIPARPTLD